jgi:hypothetical protein
LGDTSAMLPLPILFSARRWAMFMVTRAGPAAAARSAPCPAAPPAPAPERAATAAPPEPRRAAGARRRWRRRTGGCRPSPAGRARASRTPAARSAAARSRGRLRALALGRVHLGGGEVVGDAARLLVAEARGTVDGVVARGGEAADEVSVALAALFVRDQVPSLRREVAPCVHQLIPYCFRPGSISFCVGTWFPLRILCFDPPDSAILCDAPFARLRAVCTKIHDGFLSEVNICSKEATWS